MKTLKTESKRQKRSVLSILHRGNTLIRELKYLIFSRLPLLQRAILQADTA